MMRCVLGASLIGMLLLSTGCAYNSVASNNSTKSGSFFGDFGVRGNGNISTIESGSKIRNLSIWGDNNRVTVEDEVTVAKLEIYGKNNFVSLPYYLDIRMTEAAGGNTIERRPRGSYISTNRPLGPDYQLPPRYQSVSPASPDSGGTYIAPAQPMPSGSNSGMSSGGSSYPQGLGTSQNPPPAGIINPPSPSGAVTMVEQGRSPESGVTPAPAGGTSNVTPVDSSRP